MCLIGSVSPTPFPLEEHESSINCKTKYPIGKLQQKSLKNILEYIMKDKKNSNENEAKK